MKEIKAPEFFPAMGKNVFLAGSIEMGVAEQWQERLAKMLTDVDCTLLNPRRDDWDASWVQSIDNPQFKEQVEWELRGLDSSVIVVFYFDPNTKSPITLMELGYISNYPCEVVVCCPEGFWRKGNVDILCEHTGMDTANSLEEVAEFVRKILTQQF
jgi:hypothetical protein